MFPALNFWFRGIEITPLLHDYEASTDSKLWLGSVRRWDRSQLRPLITTHCDLIMPLKFLLPLLSNLSAHGFDERQCKDHAPSYTICFVIARLVSNPKTDGLDGGDSPDSLCIIIVRRGYGSFYYNRRWIDNDKTRITCYFWKLVWLYSANIPNKC